MLESANKRPFLLLFAAFCVCGGRREGSSYATRVDIQLRQQSVCRVNVCNAGLSALLNMHSLLENRCSLTATAAGLHFCDRDAFLLRIASPDTAKSIQRIHKAPALFSKKTLSCFESMNHQIRQKLTPTLLTAIQYRLTLKANPFFALHTLPCIFVHFSKYFFPIAHGVLGYREVMNEI